MLEIIYIKFDNIKNEIDKFISQELGYHSNNNSSSSTKRLKFISFFLNNKSGYFEQLTIIIEMIQIKVDDTKANDIISILFR